MLCLLLKTPIYPYLRSVSVGNSIASHKPKYCFIMCYSVAWLVGLVVGAFVATCASATHKSWARLIADSRVSIWSLLASLSVPFLLSAILFEFSLFGLVVPLIFGKAFSFSWCVCALLVGFADAGWLLSRLLVFSDFVVSVLLIWFCFRGLDQNAHRRRTDLLLCIVLSFAVGCIDFCVISPFGISLLLH